MLVMFRLDFNCFFRITFWKYPEDREDLPAEGYISLRYIVNQNVTTAKRALTSRPNTLELYSKPLKEGNHDFSEKSFSERNPPNLGF